MEESFLTQKYHRKKLNKKAKKNKLKKPLQRKVASEINLHDEIDRHQAPRRVIEKIVIWLRPISASRRKAGDAQPW